MDLSTLPAPFPHLVPVWAAGRAQWRGAAVDGAVCATGLKAVLLEQHGEEWE